MQSAGWPAVAVPAGLTLVAGIARPILPGHDAAKDKEARGHALYFLLTYMLVGVRYEEGIGGIQLPLD